MSLFGSPPWRYIYSYIYNVEFEPFGTVDYIATSWVNAALPGFPAESATGDVSARLLAGEYGFQP
jgi:hypothetical protein